MQRNDDVSASKSNKRHANTGRLLVLSLVVGMLAGGVAAVLGHVTAIPAWLLHSAAVLIVGALGLKACRDWWLNVDEGVREAHKFGWFWGGSAGLLLACAVGLGLQAIGDGSVAQLGIEPRDARLVFTGMVLAIGFMLVGYLVCWAGWWISRR